VLTVRNCVSFTWQKWERASSLSRHGGGAVGTDRPMVVVDLYSGNARGCDIQWLIGELMGSVFPVKC